jgi:predicted transposase/invertase (TIGR01784 family)
MVEQKHERYVNPYTDFGFKKTEDELVSMYDKWLFVLKNLTRLMERPAALQERVFTRLFEQAEIARFSPDETRIYEESLKHYRDIRNVVNSAERRGRDEANRENARRMKAKDYAAEDIAEITGLAKEDINAL